MEVGIDIEQNNRFKDKSQKFINTIFCSEEVDYAESLAKPYEHYCAFWCIKEAVIKAFGNHVFNPLDICTLHDEAGKPFVKLTEKIKNALSSNNLREIKISISHAKDYTTAVCIIC